MEKTDNIFLVIGTINSTYGQFDPSIRLGQTLAAIDSVKCRVSNTKIVYVDNSNDPIKNDWVKLLLNKIDHFHQLEHNLLSLYFNQYGLKSASEVNMLYSCMNLLKNFEPKGRIFKLSGRYALTDQFDINDHVRYETIGKYGMSISPCTLINEQAKYQRNTMFMEQALISWDMSIHDHFQKLLMGMLDHVIQSKSVIEETMFQFIPHNMVVPIKFEQVAGVDINTETFEQYRNLGEIKNV